MKRYTIYSGEYTVKIDADYAIPNDRGQIFLSLETTGGEKEIIAVIPPSALIIINELPKQMRDKIWEESMAKTI
jgi:hypothetical protein